MGTGINVDSKNWSTLVRIPELTLLRNLEFNQKIEDRVHIRVQVQFH